MSPHDRHDRRLLVVYLLVAVVGILFLIRSNYIASRVDDEQGRFEKVTRTNCLRQNAANAGINDLITQAKKNVRHSTALTEAQRREALKAYSRINEPIVNCDDLRRK